MPKNKPIRLVYEPFPVHLAFHLSTAREKFLQGAVGSGKTIALCADQIGWGLDLEGSKNMLVRKTAKALQDNTQQEFMTLLSTPPNEDDSDEVEQTLMDYCRIKKNSGQVDTLWLPNDSEYIFRGLDKITKRMGLNLSSIAVDEASEITLNDYLALRSRLRQRFPVGPARRRGVVWPASVRQQICLAANSGGHDWAWEYFIKDPAPNSRVFKSTSFDNPTLYNEDGTMSEFLVSMLNAPPLWVARFVYSDNDAFAGQILDFDIKRNTHTPFTPPADWERYMGLDWGGRHPTACGWWARKPGTNLWFKYREWQTYDSEDPVERDSHVPWPVYKIADKIHELENGEKIKRRATGPDTFHRRPTAEATETVTVAQHFRRKGLHFEVGAADWATRINALNTVLSNGTASVGQDLDYTIRAYQQYRYEDLTINSSGKDQPERPLKKNDHLIDADQYLFTLFLGTSVLPEVKKPETYEESVRRRIREQTKRQYNATRGRSVTLSRGPE